MGAIGPEQGEHQGGTIVLVRPDDVLADCGQRESSARLSVSMILVHELEPCPDIFTVADVAAGDLEVPVGVLDGEDRERKQAHVEGQGA